MNEPSSVMGGEQESQPGGVATQDVSPNACQAEFGTPANHGGFDAGRSVPVHRTGGVPPRSPASVSPSCGCGCSKAGQQYVYVVGNSLRYDFKSQIRYESMQSNFPHVDAESFDDVNLRTPHGLLRYFLGYTDIAWGRHRGNLYDVRSGYWVLYQDECPLYAIRPQDGYTEAAYDELLRFFVLQQPVQNLIDYGISVDCIKEFYCCHGGESDESELGLYFHSCSDATVVVPGEQGQGSQAQHGAGGAEQSGPVQKEQKGEGVKEQKGEGEKPQAPRRRMGHTAPITARGNEFYKGGKYSDYESDAAAFGFTPGVASHVAIAGEIVGSVQLESGKTVPVVAPEMRGMSTWNIDQLIDRIVHLPGGIPPADAFAFALRLISNFQEEVRNDGKAPQHRAINWAATDLVNAIVPPLGSPAFSTMLGGVKNAAVDKILPRPSQGCQLTGMEYDVEVSLFNFAEAFRGTVVLTGTIDVSDIVPVTTRDFRASTRR